jgi:N-acetylmuramoyl-L-alanine amidase
LKLSIREYPKYGRVIIGSSSAFSYRFEKNGSFLLVKIETKVPFKIQREPFENRFIKSVGWSRGSDSYIISIEAFRSDFVYGYFEVKAPFQLVVDIEAAEKPSSVIVEKEKKTEEKKPEPLLATLTPPSPPENPPSAASTSPSPSPTPQPQKQAGPSVKGIKTIVIDAGHGGLETGAKGKFGALEKDITLGLALKLKALIERNMAFRVVLTRDKDVDVSLENRAALANNNKADLFISIHCNGSYRKKAHGSETFFLSLNATDEEARRLAYFENSTSALEGQIETDNQDEIKMILWDMAQTAYIKESSQLAEIIQKELNLLLGTTDRGIKQAPFKVLTGVASPAVLVEVAFISNPEEEQKLLDQEFQNNVVQAIYRGLLSFLKLYS